MMRSWLLPIASSILLLAACGSEEHTDIKDWMKDATKDMRGRVQPLPEVKPFPVVSYDAGDLVDPFQPSRIEPDKKVGGGGLKPDMERRKEELEKFPLASIAFVGLLRNAKVLYAVLVVERRIYRVKVGSYMGLDYGKVTDIQASPGLDDGKLVLKEMVQDSGGDWTERETVIEMQVQEAKK